MTLVPASVLRMMERIREEHLLPRKEPDCPGPGQVIDVHDASPHPWGDADRNGEVAPVDSLAPA